MEQTHRRAVLAEEGARRGKKGPAAETDARARLNAATEVLARYQVPARETAELRQAAVARVAAAEGHATAWAATPVTGLSWPWNSYRTRGCPVVFEPVEDELTGGA